MEKSVEVEIQRKLEMEKAAAKVVKKPKGMQRLIIKYAKCQIEGCGGNIIPTMVYQNLPLCPRHTDMAKCLMWILNNVKLDRKVINPQEVGMRIPVSKEGLGRMTLHGEEVKG